MQSAEVSSILLKRVASAAWKRAKLGVNESFRTYRVVKRDKYVLVMPRRRDWQRAFRSDKFPFVSVVVYPEPVHFSTFEQAVESTREGGSGYHHRGAVGTVSLQAHRAIRGFYKRHLELSFAQAHFKVGTEKNQLPRRLATRYGGWRRHALTEALHVASGLGLEVWVDNKALKRFLAIPSPPGLFHHELLEVARGLGMETDMRANGIMLVPRVQRSARR